MAYKPASTFFITDEREPDIFVTANRLAKKKSRKVGDLLRDACNIGLETLKRENGIKKVTSEQTA